jgi:transcriptional regulator with XRE-family HTH domain
MGKQFKRKRFKHILGNKIRKLRTVSGITQVELAKKLGFTSTGAISQIENGLKGMKVESIIRAAEVFGVHPFILLTPYDLGQEETEIITKLFMLLEKHRRQPNMVRSYVQQLLMLLRRFDSNIESPNCRKK